jgi:hypothetical protein
LSAHELAGIAFGRERKEILVTLRAYFDGSGKEDDHPVITVGGFLADVPTCEAIEQDWESALGKRVFHFADFGTEYCKLGSGEWSANERSGFLKRLAGIVNRQGCYIIAASMEVAPFLDLIQEVEHPQEIGPAFSACAYLALTSVETILVQEKRRSVKLRYVFEKGDREHEISNVIFGLDKANGELHRLRGHGFEPKETTLLQPADLIAGIVQRCVWRAHKAFPCLENGKPRTPLQTFERHYSEDGVTSAVVSNHDLDKCWLYSPLVTQSRANDVEDYLMRHPEELEKRKKILRYKPKPSKKAT